MKWPGHLPQLDLLTALTFAYIAGLVLATITELPLQVYQWLEILIPCLSLIAYLSRARRLGRMLIIIFFLVIGGEQGIDSAMPPQADDHVFTRITRPKEAVLLGQVATMPSFDGRVSHTEVDLRSLRTVDSPHFQPTRGRVLLSLSAPWPSRYPPGTLLAIRAELERPAGFITPGTFDYPAYLARKDIWIVGKVRGPALLAPVEESLTLFARLRYFPEKIRTRIAAFLHASLPAETRGLYKGVLIGDSADVSAAVLENFKASGTMHILAMS